MHSGIGSGFYMSSSSIAAHVPPGPAVSGVPAAPVDHHKQYIVFPPSFTLVIFLGVAASAAVGSLVHVPSFSFLISSHFWNFYPAQLGSDCLSYLTHLKEIHRVREVGLMGVGQIF